MLFLRSYLTTSANIGITNKISKYVVIKSKTYMLIENNLITHPKTSKFDEAFEFYMISSYYSYNIQYVFVSTPLSRFSYHILHSGFRELYSVYYYGLR